MKRSLTYFGVPAVCVLSFMAGLVVSSERDAAQSSAIVPQSQAEKEEFDWGTLYTYFEGDSFGTRDALTAVAVIKPGQEIHPPHDHSDEEYLMVVSGSGMWHLNGADSPAQTGDILYAKPWDVHGIKNTGDTPLTFVVWKWQSKGVGIPARP
jgi:mannose-6-phosphate isomerase-like protein (cupin superfamily)